MVELRGERGAGFWAKLGVEGLGEPFTVAGEFRKLWRDTGGSLTLTLDLCVPEGLGPLPSLSELSALASS
jgi:hypothetical protein